MTLQASPIADGAVNGSKLWLRVGLICGLLVLAGVLAVLAWTWRHPTALQPYGNGIGRTGVKPGSTVYATITDPHPYTHGYKDGDTVTLHRVALHNLHDTTGATLAYYLCAVTSGPIPLGIYSQPELRQSCASLVPGVGAHMSLSGQELLVAVTPHRRGVFVFQGADVHYSHRWQDGSQRTGFDTRIAVK